MKATRAETGRDSFEMAHVPNLTAGNTGNQNGPLIVYALGKLMGDVFSAWLFTLGPM